MDAGQPDKSSFLIHLFFFLLHTIRLHHPQCITTAVSLVGDWCVLLVARSAAPAHIVLYTYIYIYVLRWFDPLCAKFMSKRRLLFIFKFLVTCTLYHHLSCNLPGCLWGVNKIKFHLFFFFFGNN